MTTQLTFGELFEANRVDGDARATAAAICKQLGFAKLTNTALFEPIVQHCDFMFRNVVRRLERTVERPGRPSTATACRSELMVATFALGDGRRVPWGDATVEDHRERVALLTAHRDGVDATIRKHLDAIEAIEAAAVKCLNEIEAAA